MRRFSKPLGVTVSLLVATLALDMLRQSGRPESLVHPLDTIGMRIGDWTGSDNPDPPDRILDSLKASSYLTRTYRQQSKDLGLFIAFYGEQRAGESMHSPKHCLPGGGWEPLAQSTVLVPAGGQQVQVQKYIVQKGSDKMLVLYWYQSKRRIVSSEYAGKIYLVWDAIIHGQVGSTIVRLTLPDYAGAVKDGISFASQIIPQVQTCLGQSISKRQI